MKSQTVIILFLCSIAGDASKEVVSGYSLEDVATTQSLIKVVEASDLSGSGSNSGSGDGDGEDGFEKRDQKSNIEKLDERVREIGARLNKELKTSSSRKKKSVEVFQGSIRTMLEDYGLKFLIKKLKDAKVNLKKKPLEVRSGSGVCFVCLVYKLFCLDGPCTWKPVTEIVCF